ncbi:MAG TPA: hypothetical protein VGK01_16500 [Candidatus Angelobacter sp.]|jgi:hypothetical protein
MHRGSADVDFIIEANEMGGSRLLDQLPKQDFYSDLHQALDAFRHQSMFNVMDHVTGLKIDFIFLKSRRFSQEEFHRRKQVTVWGVPLYIATPEDIVLSKLEWAKLDKSSRQIEDAAGILKVRSGELDRPYIEKWVAELGISSEWARARQLADLE